MLGSESSYMCTYTRSLYSALKIICTFLYIFHFMGL
ncbi:hypothetical protein M8C21_029538 [Ambrosia artemisiifolia]|uniref:Uncharacterized protein n=1 Tax=Ambrosia artemisiifolia TaxID=4212 RepID=A0AAD5BYY3_AMBAR|nr:hypothetical protein M8C21_029538 [Ambrosia artemisiifolia]